MAMHYGCKKQRLPACVKNAGYATGHFGKWHLNGLKGAGVPILASDTHHPGHFGFDQWVSVSNFFDRDPLMSRQGKFEDFAGDSSDVVVAEALEFISQQAHSQQPSFTVIWFGSPHSPWLASDQDLKPFEGLDESSKHHYGELVAMDRSIGTLRDGLQRFGIADNTLVWFCSDNGGLRKINPGTTARMRGKKGSVYEGGLRVPAIVQWPGKIKPSVTDHLACTMDIFPTLVDLLGLDDSVAPNELDGISLKPLFNAKVKQREKPIPFRFENQIALIDHRFKLMSLDRRQASFTLYDLHNDPRETTDVAAQHPEVAARMQEQLRTWNESVQASAAGKDYPSGKVDSNHPGTRAWTEVEAYKPFFPEWRQRWEYERYFAPRRK